VPRGDSLELLYHLLGIIPAYRRVLGCLFALCWLFKCVFGPFVGCLVCACGIVCGEGAIVGAWGAAVAAPRASCRLGRGATSERSAPGPCPPLLVCWPVYLPSTRGHVPGVQGAGGVWTAAAARVRALRWGCARAGPCRCARGGPAPGEAGRVTHTQRGPSRQRLHVLGQAGLCGCVCSDVCIRLRVRHCSKPSVPPAPPLPPPPLSHPTPTPQGSASCRCCASCARGRRTPSCPPPSGACWPPRRTWVPPASLPCVGACLYVLGWLGACLLLACSLWFGSRPDAGKARTPSDGPPRSRALSPPFPPIAAGACRRARRAAQRALPRRGRAARRPAARRAAPRPLRRVRGKRRGGRVAVVRGRRRAAARGCGVVRGGPRVAPRLAARRRARGRRRSARRRR
jgi:hypothetical protein